VSQFRVVASFLLYQKWQMILRDPNRKFELMFRTYAPTAALFKKDWVLPDMEKVH